MEISNLRHPPLDTYCSGLCDTDKSEAKSPHGTQRGQVRSPSSQVLDFTICVNKILEFIFWLTFSNFIYMKKNDLDALKLEWEKQLE